MYRSEIGRGVDYRASIGSEIVKAGSLAMVVLTFVTLIAYTGYLVSKP